MFGRLAAPLPLVRITTAACSCSRSATTSWIARVVAVSAASQDASAVASKPNSEHAVATRLRII